MTRNIMWRFMKDLYGAMFRQQSLTGENFISKENLRTLALEIAAAPTYKGDFANFYCSNNWLTQFRKDFNLKREERKAIEEPCVNTLSKEDEEYINFMTAKKASSIRETFSQDLYEELSRRQSLTDENLKTNKKLRVLALELAEDPKYSGYIEYSGQMSKGYITFSDEWLNQFRKKFGFETVEISEKFIPREEADLIREVFSQDLYNEIYRRQSLSDENLTTYEKLRALAVELAADPKYQGYLSSYKFCNSWLTRFRKKMNFEEIEKLMNEKGTFLTWHLARKSFSEELFEEAESRRQRLCHRV